MHKVVLSILLLIFSTISFAGETRQVFRVASDQAIEVLRYDERSDSFLVTYTGIEKITGFEDCKLHDVIVEVRLVCGDESYTLNAPSYVGDCEYRGLHRINGLGFNKKSTWEAWVQAAQACGASAEQIEKYSNRKATWAEKDSDKRF